MNIQIRVLSAKANAELRQMSSQINQLERDIASANRMSSAFGVGGFKAMEKWGSQLQWAGRQLVYNFTLPIVAAGTAATKFALDNERALTRLKKVYGDGVRGAAFYRQEIDALGRSFEMMSNKFGVAKSDVINIAADWAAAGASGLALAKSTQLTLQTMILGELEASKATEALISIQAQYGESIDDLARTIDILNMVENQTGASMSGLIEAFQRSAGVARSAGIDVEHLAAMIAALVPASGSASQAGNALKTIISRLLSPTKEAAEVMGLMGIHTQDFAWQSLNGTQRIEKMAEAFKGLSTSQRAVVSSVVASRWQINKFDILMRDIINTNGYYQKSLKATGDVLANQRQREMELQAVLQSSPQKFKQIITVIQNVASDAVLPLLPTLIRLGHAIVGVFTAFQNLDPNIQKLIIGFLLLVAAVGPVLKIFGALNTLVGYVGSAVMFFGGGVGKLIGWIATLALAPFKVVFAGIMGIGTAVLKVAAIVAGGFPKIIAVVRVGSAAVMAAMTGPWGLAIAAILGLIVAFRNQLANLWNNIATAFSENSNNLMSAFAPVVGFFQNAVGWIEKAFWKLPKGVRDAMMAVISLVRSAAESVSGFFGSILQPFSGGGIEKHASGGLIRGPGTGRSDSILAAVSNGEYIVNADSAARHRGILEAINSNRYADGGIVGATSTSGTTKQLAGASVTQDVAAYQKIAAALNGIEWNKELAAVAEGFHTALPLFKRLLADYNALTALADKQADAVERQQQVVDAWKQKLDAANVTVDIQQAKLQSLESTLDDLTASYDAHRAAMESFANAPIEGMQDMSDAIFENQLAQKKLQLQMLQWEQQHGSIDKVKNSMALLQGEIEKMQGNISGLRAAGAGSDITGPLDEQLQAMKDSYAAMGQQVNNSPINQLQEQLDELSRQGQILDLENSIQFDPLTRQIEQLANGMEELPFDQIIAGINREKDAMAVLEPQIAAATAAVDAQKAAVDAAVASRDAIQERYDLETIALDVLRQAYDETVDSINDVEDAMRGLSTAANDNIQKMREAAEAAKQNKLSPGGQNFLDAAGANFPEVGDINQKIGREGGLEDQSALIDEWIKKNAEGISFDGMDMFAPIKDMWNKAWKWVEDNISPTVKRIWDATTQFVSDAFGGDVFEGIGDSFKSAWETVGDWWNGFVGFVKSMWHLFGDDVMKIFGAIGDFFLRIWNEIGPSVGKFFTSLWGFIQASWPIIQTLIAILGVGLLGAFKIVAAVISNVFGPVLNFIIDTLNAVIQVATGLLDFFTGVFTGNWSLMWEGIKEIFTGIWDAIFGLFNGIVQTVWGIVKGFVEGIVGFFTWLWDELVGHSIVPDMINAIVEWFVNAGIWLIDTVSKFIGGIIDWFAKLPGRVWEALFTLKDKLVDVATTAFKWFLDAQLRGWSNIWNWLITLPQAAWNGLISLKDKLSDVASRAFASFLQSQINGWSNIWNWLITLPQSAWNGLIALKDKLFDVGIKAMTGLWTAAKSIWDGPSGILSWFGGIPGKIATALSGAAGVVADVVKKAWNGAASWINSHAISPLNSITSRFGLNIPNLPQFAKGGVIPGPVSDKDNILIAARTGEGVVVPEAVNMLGGKNGIERLNQVASRGGDLRDFMRQGEFGVGGSIFDSIEQWLKQGAGNAVSNLLNPIAGLVETVVPRPELMKKFLSGKLRQLAEAASHWGDDQDAKTIWPVGNAPITAPFGQYPNGGVHRGVDFGVPVGTLVKAFRAGQVMTSGWDNTGFGNFVEISHANGIVSRYGHNSRLLRDIGETVAAGMGISYSGNTGNSTGPHLHFEIKKNGTAVDPMPYLNGQYDRGGYLQPGLTMARNATGRPEPVFTSEQWAILSRVVAVSSSMLKSAVDPGAGLALGARSAAGVRLEARIRALETGSSATSRNGSVTTININGDLVLPNIRSGDDAEAFIKHLETLAG